MPISSCIISSSYSIFSLLLVAEKELETRGQTELIIKFFMVHLYLRLNRSKQHWPEAATYTRYCTSKISTRSRYYYSWKFGSHVCIPESKIPSNFM